MFVKTFCSKDTFMTLTNSAGANLLPKQDKMPIKTFWESQYFMGYFNSTDAFAILLFEGKCLSSFKQFAYKTGNMTKDAV